MSAPKFLAISLAALALAAPAFGKSPTTSNLRQQMQAVYSRMNQAYMRLNVDGLLAFYDPSYVGVDTDKKVTNLAQIRQGIQFAFRERSHMHVTCLIEKVEPWQKGVVAVVQGVEEWDTDGGTLHMKVMETDEDYWVKSGGAWKLKQENELSEFTWHNGQPYNG